MRNSFLFFALMIPLAFSAQYLLPNEETIFSFDTKNGKKMSLVKDKKNGYIQYRFGSKDHVEMEFPNSRTKDSWKQFTYNSYHRGGGKQNAGMDLNYLSFSKNNYKYQLFRTYDAENESFSTGITVTDSKGKETEISGVYKTIKGCMCHLEDTEVKKEDFGL
ncbi:hypothetical protein B0A69_20565 [Chryseobacterium shigense]|uniref:Uncharacterized protein n=1 Tax=Chryseobacterium shigense TaxID=297244 RepID=A0A1N7KIQ0_9FLAO|nr:hypothetical protein [Chryseobacterium shigense]PQA90332.1 hypothetical protein B0A69_20565 [Chryseobacterium shigense]SIS61320.1 hypothetical protein SAMN05421639_11122 [Chryseobacterium shigense]